MQGPCAIQVTGWIIVYLLSKAEGRERGKYRGHPTEVTELRLSFERTETDNE